MDHLRCSSKSRLIQSITVAAAGRVCRREEINSKIKTISLKKNLWEIQKVILEDKVETKMKGEAWVMMEEEISILISTQLMMFPLILTNKTLNIITQKNE